MHWFHKYVESFFFWICISYIRLNLLNKHWITNWMLHFHCVLSIAALPATPLPPKSSWALKHLSTSRFHLFLAKKLAHRRSSVSFPQQRNLSFPSAPSRLEREGDESFPGVRQSRSNIPREMPLPPLTGELAGAHWRHTSPRFSQWPSQVLNSAVHL